MHHLNRCAIVTDVLSQAQRKGRWTALVGYGQSQKLNEHKRKSACASNIVATSNLYAKDLSRKVTFYLCVKQTRHQRATSPLHHVRTENQESGHQHTDSAGGFMLALSTYRPAIANVCQSPAT